ncbi:hypothetical protein FRC10_000221 [Ceratobasidium sp. 414]|nr:hypothetical protein FRC10_000221 [Ceratobasidium sp. 414]
MPIQPKEFVINCFDAYTPVPNSANPFGLFAVPRSPREIDSSYRDGARTGAEFGIIARGIYNAIRKIANRVIHNSKQNLRMPKSSKSESISTRSTQTWPGSRRGTKISF